MTAIRTVDTLPAPAARTFRKGPVSPSGLFAEDLLVALIAAPLGGAVVFELPPDVSAKTVRSILQRRVQEAMPAKTATFYVIDGGDHAAALVTRMTP